ncbi:hypothetical protein OpiT1DRAFT_05431 [Opitutaceae bacterium TAV1]|nr:hypothetical protein OpiT1DRAFT_05431 [Opitutaceae bacterium TAV1]
MDIGAGVGEAEVAIFGASLADSGFAWVWMGLRGFVKFDRVAPWFVAGYMSTTNHEYKTAGRIVAAIQFDGRNSGEIHKFTGGKSRSTDEGKGRWEEVELEIVGPGGEIVTANVGDWIVNAGDGEFPVLSVCKQGDFAALYEPVAPSGAYERLIAALHGVENAGFRIDHSEVTALDAVPNASMFAVVLRVTSSAGAEGKR